MKDPQTALIRELMTRTFNTSREPRSLEYRQGVQAVFEFRVLGKRMNCVYVAGSAQSDAFFAGADEGHSRWREYLKDLKTAAAKSETAA